MMIRKALLLSLVMLGTIPSHAEEKGSAFPVRPITIVYPYPAGGLSDNLLRQVGRAVEKALGQPVVMDYRPGAASLIGSQSVARAKPDGYTLLTVTPSFLINPLMLRNAGYDPLKDFTPVVQFIASPTILVTHPSTPGRNFQEFLAYFRANPGKLTIGTGGTGFPNDIYASMLENQTHIGLVRIPYKGESQTLTDVLGGQVHAAFMTPGTFRQYAGKLKAIAVTGTKRLPQMPDVPTFRESGISGLEMVGYGGLVAPAGTDPAVVAKLYGAMQQFLKDPQTVTAWESQYDVEVTGLSPAEFGAQMREHVPRWREALKSYEGSSEK